MARYENAFYAPMLSDWRNLETREEAGSQNATQRANELYKRILAEFDRRPWTRRSAMNSMILSRDANTKAGLPRPKQGALVWIRRS